MSSAYDVSGCCTTDTVYPSFLRMLATASQPEPSAKAPCTKTTFLIVIVVLLFSFQFFSHASALVRCLLHWGVENVPSLRKYLGVFRGRSRHGDYVSSNVPST